MVLIQLLLPTKASGLRDAMAALNDTRRELAEKFEGRAVSTDLDSCQGTADPVARRGVLMKTSPSGATDRTIEREEKFDEELEKALSESPDSEAPGAGNTGRLPERSEFRPDQERKPK